MKEFSSKNLYQRMRLEKPIATLSVTDVMKAWVESKSITIFIIITQFKDERYNDNNNTK